MDQIYGYIERITYQNPENGYTVAQLKENTRTDLVCIVGSMPTLQAGETVRCLGEWKNHLVHGKQFEVTQLKTEAPADIIGIKKYLGSGLIKGIGPTYAGRIVEKFGIDTLNVIENTPEKLLQIPRLGRKRLQLIITCWSEQRSVRDIMIFLQSNGVTPSYAQKIFKAYGNQSIKKVTENPYSLAREISGIGFKTADHIAEKLGIQKNSSQRIDSGIEYVLSELSGDGHVCYPTDEFIIEAQAILEVDSESINPRLNFLYEDNRIELFEIVYDGKLRPFIWIKPLFLSETGIVREIKRLKKSPCNLRAIDTKKALIWVQDFLKIDLAENQIKAVVTALEQKVQIITGGPGTGKSTITNAILTITDKLTKQIVLTAPTGRAAKRMSEITGKKAVTIHSLLEFDTKKWQFKRNRDNPLECDLIIVDEASMIDTLLMYSLLKAIPNHARVVFVGDINQLPSVGPGNVLRDMMSSNSIPVTMLNQIFRQAAGSRIITNAHRVNNGTFPDISNQINSDFFFMESLEPEGVLKDILALVTQRLPKKYRFDILNDIQVLAPMKKGIIGTENLNIALQQAINKNTETIFRGGKKFLVGDKVMQLRNDYKREVYNGDIGIIINIDQESQQVVVLMNDREVFYEYSHLDDLTLAYAVSVHKYQGCECPCIVMPIHTTHFKLLHRNLLYTGMTRGKKLVILVGTKKALAIAVKNDEVKKRYSGLHQALVSSENISVSLTA